MSGLVGSKIKSQYLADVFAVDIQLLLIENFVRQSISNGSFV